MEKQAKFTVRIAKKTRCVATSIGLMAAVSAMSLATYHAARADMIVVASTAVGYGAGHVVTDGAGVTVPAGASLTLLDQSGKTLVISGPFDGVPQAGRKAGEGSALVSALASLIKRTERTTNTLGASRSAYAGGNNIDRPSDAIDVALGGKYCLSGRSAQIFRSDASAAGSVALRNARTKKSVSISLVKDQNTAPWPNDLPLQNGEDYVVQPTGQIAGTRFSISIVDRIPNAPADAIKALADAGCDIQAHAILTQMAAAHQTPGLFLTSDRGRQPRYEPGEMATLTLQSNFDAHLYCFYFDDKQGLVTLFPYDNSVDSWIAASHPVSLPGSRLPVAFQLSDKGSTARFLCYATDRDVRADLPAGLMKEGFAATTNIGLADVKTVFRRLPVKSMASSELKIEVSE